MRQITVYNIKIRNRRSSITNQLTLAKIPKATKGAENITAREEVATNNITTKIKGTNKCNKAGTTKARTISRKNKTIPFQKKGTTKISNDYHRLPVGGRLVWSREHEELPSSGG